MRRPIFTDSFAPVPVSLRCSCGATITDLRIPGQRPDVVPEGCSRCWPRWIEKRLARAVLVGVSRELAMAS